METVSEKFSQEMRNRLFMSDTNDMFNNAYRHNNTGTTPTLTTATHTTQHRDTEDNTTNQENDQ